MHNFEMQVSIQCKQKTTWKLESCDWPTLVWPICVVRKICVQTRQTRISLSLDSQTHTAFAKLLQDRYISCFDQFQSLDGWHPVTNFADTCYLIPSPWFCTFLKHFFFQFTWKIHQFVWYICVQIQQQTDTSSSSVFTLSFFRSFTWAVVLVPHDDLLTQKLFVFKPLK